MTLPAMRVVDMFPIEHEGEQVFCISDPTQIVETQLFLTPPAVFVAALLNGVNTVEDIQKEFKSNFGGMSLAPERIQEVVDHLDEHGYLANERYDAMRAEVIGAYRALPNRPAYLAGKSYPNEAEGLREFLDGQFTRGGAPGEVPAVSANGGPALPGLIVPHIDLERGGYCYAHGYARMLEHGAPETVFIFGVAHAAEPVPFILTRKDFDTPLGAVKTDAELVDRLAGVCTWDPFDFELTHRTEHSIEFQVVMLRHMYGDRVKIVPILCSMFGESPGEEEPIQKFLAECRAAVEERPGKVSVIASVDLAHVGMRFGDAYDIDESVVDFVKSRDDEDMERVYAMDAEGFYASVMRDANDRKVCGLNAIYATLKTLEGSAKAGEALHYGYAHDPAGGIVSFASAALS